MDQFTAEPSKIQMMEHFSLYFSLGQMGEISAVHAHKQDPAHIVNLKRGILSALQLQKDASAETDVNGECAVTTITLNNGTTIVKTKDLTKCNKRAVNEIGIQSASIQSESSALKPLASSSKCTYTTSLKKGTIKNVVCEESHLFRPFSAGFESTAGALTTVKQTLKLIAYKAKGGTPKMFGDQIKKDHTVNSGMLFDHTKEEVKSMNTINTKVEKIMERLVDLSREGAAKQDSAHEFTSLVQMLRKMNYWQLGPVWRRYFDCEASEVCHRGQTDLRDIYRQYLMDAVTYCGTPTCVSVIRDVIMDGDITGETMNMLLQAIAFLGKTSSKMIRDVLLIVSNQPSRQAFLTLGTLLGRHCKNNEKECRYDNASPITQAAKFLKDTLGNECREQNEPDKLEAILMALKAIGNAGRPVTASETILSCAENSEHNNLTVAAFDSLRAMPCTYQRSERILTMVSDENMCPEKRSHAFRALIKCPDDAILGRLVSRLKKEPSKQLASLMYTTLSNIAESSDPKNAKWKEFMQKYLPLEEVNMPVHQFSHNFEKSFLVDKLNNSGVTAEGDLIFNPDGYLPKSAFFNLTANVMGVPVHMVEAAVMVDGLETILEDVFGPEGTFPENTVFNLFNLTLTKENFDHFAKLRNERDDAEYAAKQRKRRGVDDNLTKLHKKVNKQRAQPSGSLSFKLMGQEVRVFSYDDLFWAIDKIDNTNVINMLLDVAKGGHKTFTKSMMFLELTHEVATGLGLPLKLKLLGSTVSTFELDGKFDIRNMFWGPASMQVSGYARQSSVVEISGNMGIESHFVSTGMFVNASAFSSQMLKGNIEYKQGKLLKVNLDTPDDPIQLFNFSSTPFMYLNEDTVLIEGTPRKITPDFCLQSVYLGMGLCTSARLPVAFREYETPYFPLSGPAHFDMKLVKADKKLTTYQFLMNMEKSVSGTRSVMSLSTPGATYERNLTVNMKYRETDSKLVLIIGTKDNGKGTEIDMSYDIDSRSVGLAIRQNAFTKTDVEYNFDLFNESTTQGRQYGMRVQASYDWYTFKSETKMVIRKSGPLFTTTTTYYPSKTLSGSIEYNRLNKTLYAKFNTQDFNQTVDVFAKSTKDGIMLNVMHAPSGTKAFVMVSINVDFAGKKGEVSATLKHADNKELVLDGNINGLKGTYKLGYYTRNNDSFVALTIGDIQLSKLGYYEQKNDHFQTTKTLKWEIYILNKTMKVYSILDTTDEKQVLDIGAAFNQYKAGAKFDYMTKYASSRELCSSVYYNGGQMNLDPFLVCSKFESFTQPETYIPKTIKFTTKLKKMDKMFKIHSDFERHVDHTTIKSFLTFNEKNFWNSIDATYNDMTNSTLSIGFGAGDLKSDPPAFGGRLFSTKEGKDQKFGIEGSFNKSNLAIVTTYSTGKGDMNIKTEMLLNKEPLPINTALSYFYGDVSGTNMTLKIADWLMTYTMSMKLKAPRNNMNILFTVTKGVEQKLKLYAINIVGWTATKKSFEQLFVAVVADKTFWNILDATYNDMTSTLSVGFGAGDLKSDPTTFGGRMFSTKEGKDQKFGIEGSFNKSNLSLVTTYSTGKGDRNIKIEILLNKEPLPVNTALSYFYGDVSGITLKVADWSMTYNMSMKLKAPKRKMNFVFKVTKGVEQKLTLYAKNIVGWTVSKKSFEQKFGVIVADKTFQYGYQFEFMNKSIEKSVYTGMFKLNWSTKNYSAISIMLANGNKAAKAQIEVEYLPNKTMTHLVTYDKKKSKLYFSLEFLPKVFVKFSSNLGSKTGFEMISNASISGENFEKSTQWLNEYTNTKKNLTMSIIIGKKIQLSAIITPTPVLNALAVGKNFEIVGFNKLDLRFMLNDEEKLAVTSIFELNRVDNKDLVFNGNFFVDSGTLKVGYYTPDNDLPNYVISLTIDNDRPNYNLTLTIGDIKLSKLSYYKQNISDFQTKKTLKWEIYILNKTMKIYSILDTTDEKQVLDIGAAFNQYKAGAKFDYITKYAISRELCSSVYYNGGQTNLDPFLVCSKFETFTHQENCIHKRIIFATKLKKMDKIDKMFKIQSDFEMHVSHTTLKSFITFNKTTIWNSLNTTYNGMTNSTLSVGFGVGDLKRDPPTFGGRMFSTKEGKDQKFGIEGSFNKSSLALVNTYSTGKGDMNIKTEILLNKEPLPVNTALSYFYGDVSGTDMTLNVGKWSMTYNMSMKLKAPKRKMNFNFTVAKGVEQKLKFYAKNILGWTTTEKSFEQKFGAVVAGKTFQHGYQFEFMDTSNDNSRYTGNFKLNWSTKRRPAISLMIVNGAAKAQIDVKYPPSKPMTYSVIYQKKNGMLSFSLDGKEHRFGIEGSFNELANKCYTEADTFLRTVIIPDLTKEAVSVINQTLRVSVELIKDSMNAFKPHFILARDTANDLFSKLKSDSVKDGEVAMNELNQVRFRIDNVKNEKAVKVKNILELNYQAVGMIFGKSHILTFDGKFYDFVDYKNKHCTYLLARDFMDGKFTIKSTEKSIIVDTEDMSVQIGSNGKTLTKFEGKTTKSLPAKWCRRTGEFIKCSFNKQGIEVIVDLKHFIAMISLSGWHHGKSQGLLGTNNREAFDDWKMPNEMIARNVYELANAYELSWENCIVRTQQPYRPTFCDKRPSPRCREIFKSNDSPFTGLFSKKIASAFFKACESDTAACDNNARYETSHCNATAAAVMYAKASMWTLVDLPDDCKNVITKDARVHVIGSS